MNFNFKNLSENTKRIRIIPKNGTELSANIAVDNPTAMIDEDGVFSVCLSPYEIPEYGDWIINQGFDIVGDDIKYTAYKTNSLNYYDSFALTDLEQALVKSFSDPDLQQYAAFTSAVEQLTGTTDWVLDPANNQIRYKDHSVPVDPNDPAVQWIYYDSLYNKRASSPSGVCSLIDGIQPGWTSTYSSSGGAFNLGRCIIKRPSIGDTIASSIGRAANPAYDPEAEDDREKTLPLEVVAQKVISNAESSEDEVLQLLSQDYITLVINSIFETDSSKQFVDLEDLIPQLETNKVLRN